MLVKDCDVEVSSEEKGFIRAWFRGILRENPTKSGRKKLRGQYKTLLSEEDGESPLFESIEPKFIIHVPSEILYDDVVLEEGSVVDDDHEDGWWTGFVLKKETNDSFLVYFDSPPDVIKFKKKQLRPHPEWTGFKWNIPKNKVLDKSMYFSRTMVEIRDVVEKKATLLITVDFRRVRPTPLPSSPGEYKLSESVEAFHDYLRVQGIVRRVLLAKIYMVSLESTSKEHVFKHSDLRPLKNQRVTESPLLIPPPVFSIAKEYVSTATLSPVITPTPLEQKETKNEENKQPKKTCAVMMAWEMILLNKRCMITLILMLNSLSPPIQKV
ncbi:unnamed protein product [Cochlearia groenlandica]